MFNKLKQFKDLRNQAKTLQAALAQEYVEYEKNGVHIAGFKSYHDKKQGAERGEVMLYKIEAEGASILHCGDLGVIPNDEFIEDIGEVDILMVPTGGLYTIDPAEAAQLVQKIEPSIVIPMHYNHPKLNQQAFGKLSSVDEFLKKLGVDQQAPVPKLTVKKENLAEGMQVVVMEIASS